MIKLGLSIHEDDDKNIDDDLPPLAEGGDAVVDSKMEEVD
jgi:hypothetical protein